MMQTPKWGFTLNRINNLCIKTQFFRQFCRAVPNEKDTFSPLVQLTSSEKQMEKYFVNKQATRYIIATYSLLPKYTMLTLSKLDLLKHYLGEKEVGIIILGTNVIRSMAIGKLSSTIHHMQEFGYPLNGDGFVRFLEDSSKRYSYDCLDTGYSINRQVIKMLTRHGMPLKLAKQTQQLYRKISINHHQKDALLAYLEWKFGLTNIKNHFALMFSIDHIENTIKLLKIKPTNQNIEQIFKICQQFDLTVQSNVAEFLVHHGIWFGTIESLQCKLDLFSYIHIDMKDVDINTLRMCCENIRSLILDVLSIMPLDELRNSDHSAAIITTAYKLYISHKYSHKKIEEDIAELFQCHSRAEDEKKYFIFMFCCCVKLDIPKKEVVYFLNIVSFRNAPTLALLQKNLDFLLSLGYTVGEISSAFQIIFFDNEIVAECFSKYNSDNYVDYGREEYLQLVLFYIYERYYKLHSGYL